MSTKRSPEQIFMAVFGAVIVMVSSPCVIAMLHDLIVGADNITGALMVGGFFTVTAIIGLVLAYFGLRKPGARAFEVTEAVERRVLRVAREHGGRVTVSELALGSHLSIDQCDAALRHFEERDVARTHISPEGDIVYLFPHFADEFDKASARDPVDEQVVFDNLADEIEAAATEQETVSSKKQE